ncbi:MAG: hypothetical protein WAM14_14730 [Candidatus Nitrosopolaris sp.]
MAAIDKIFQRQYGRDDYKDKARMYQDILIFGSTIPENQEFKLTDLAKYLRHNNEELRDRHLKSKLKLKKLTESNKIEYIKRRVKRNVDNLVDMRLMTQVRLVKQERGTGLIPTYTYTRFGYFFSQVIQSLRSDVNVEAKLYDLFQGMWRVQPDYSQSHIIFNSNWIKKMYEKGHLGHYISIYKKAINSKSIRNIQEFASILQRTVNIRFFHERVNALIYMTTWKETIEELEPEVRKLYLNEIKLNIDGIMNSSSLTLEYEKLRFSLIADVEVVALEGYCTECKQRPVLQMKIVEYYQRLAHAFTPLNGLVMQCPKCNSPHKTLQLPNVWLKDHPLYKSI